MAAVLIITIIAGGVALMVLLSGIALYNRLVTLRRLVRSSRSDMEALLRKRRSTGQTSVDGGGQWRGAADDVLLAYKEALSVYNTALETFPANLMARWFGMEKEEPPEGPTDQAPSS